VELQRESGFDIDGIEHAVTLMLESVSKVQ
jgi:hypothetical protein